MEVNIVNQTADESWMTYEKEFQDILTQTAKTLKLKEDYCCSLILVDEQQIHEINRDYRNIDRPTDVISFAMKDSEDEMMLDEIDDELGDIFINVKAVVDQAKSYGHSERREICFLFTHGLLHLLGYDHMEIDDEKIMFGLQDVILNALDI